MTGSLLSFLCREESALNNYHTTNLTPQPINTFGSRQFAEYLRSKLSAVERPYHTANR